MAESKSPNLVPSNLKPYFSFSGLDRSRPLIGMDDGKGQPLYGMRNAYADWRGVMVREPAYQQRIISAAIKHLRFYNRSGIAYAEENGAGINLVAEKGNRVDKKYAIGEIITSTVFNGQVHFMCAGHPIMRTEGFTWSTSLSSAAPGFGVTILGRMYCAGFVDAPGLIQACRANNSDIFPAEEPASSTSTTKAAFLDIINSIGTADFITGLGGFEVNRLAIFTNDQTLVYQVDPDYTAWELDQRANIRVGTISHNTIQNAGSDILFCSRRGVHALTRQATSTSIGEIKLSNKVELLYKALLRTVSNLADISAAYDQDEGHYHIYFPQGDGTSLRLSANINQGYENITWFEGDESYPLCGDFLAGQLVVGSNDGAWQKLDVLAPISVEDDLTDDVIRGHMDIMTPLLWHGFLDEQKESNALILQAAGSGTIQITAYDDDGQEMLVTEIQIEDVDDPAGDFPQVPLKKQFRIPFQLRYRGLQLQFESVDHGDIQILGFAIELQEDTA